MTKELDVYRDWLGIQETTRPLTHYQLLRVKQFEDDSNKICQHSRKMNTHVRKYATGKFSRQSQQLLNELAKAMLCLTDARRKAEYDASLGRREKASGNRRTLEEILIYRKLIDPTQLEKARKYADAVGLEIRDALLQQKLATAEAVMQAWAESIGLPYVELSEVGVDESLVGKVPTYTARQHSCVPVMVDEGQLLMASPNPLKPDVEDDLRVRTGMPVRSVLCTPGDIHAMIEKYYPKGAAVALPSEAAAKETPEDSSGQKKSKGLLGRLFKK